MIYCISLVQQHFGCADYFSCVAFLACNFGKNVLNVVPIRLASFV